MVLTVLGVVLLLLTRPGVWNWLNNRSIELNPLRRGFRRRFPASDVAIWRLNRVALRIFGALILVLGAASSFAYILG